LHEALKSLNSLILLLSPSLRQSQELFKKVQDVYRALAYHAPLQAESALQYEMNNGSRIISLPGTEPTIRGYSSVDLLIIDEAARVSDDLYFACKPMMAIKPQARTLALSTPAGARGFWHHEWTTGDNWQHILVPAEQCPRISRAFLDSERRSLPRAWYDAEYCCVFTDAENALFRHEDLIKAVTTAVKPLWGGHL
jgi:hypothetical protein